MKLLPKTVDIKEISVEKIKTDNVSPIKKKTSFDHSDEISKLSSKKVKN